jgi:hypothetical protein
MLQDLGTKRPEHLHSTPLPLHRLHILADSFQGQRLFIKKLKITSNFEAEPKSRRPYCFANEDPLADIF